jgi:hypothetical protein
MRICVLNLSGKDSDEGQAGVNKEIKFKVPKNIGNS